MWRDIRVNLSIGGISIITGIFIKVYRLDLAIEETCIYQHIEIT